MTVVVPIAAEQVAAKVSETDSLMVEKKIDEYDSNVWRMRNYLITSETRKE